MSKIQKVLRTTGIAKMSVSGQGDAVKLTTVIPMRIVRHRFSKVIVRPTDAPNTEGERNWQAAMDAHLIKALARAVYWQDLLDTGHVANISELAKSEGLEKMRVQKTLKMARLAPAVVEQIARGQGPVGLSFEFFVRKPLPHDWDEQKVVLGELCS